MPKSRRKTPWDDDSNATPTQIFLRDQYKEHYTDHHSLLKLSGEAGMVNSFIPKYCPFCYSSDYNKSGYTKSDIQRYKCNDCGKSFIPTTGTIFDEHKISISEWMEYVLNLFRHVSLSADSWNNKNALTTSIYWLKKLFLVLGSIQSNTAFSKLAFAVTF
jgi:transposase-like protein